MRLPPELHTLICQNMTKAELKVARLICKSFDQAAVPFLFDEVFVTASYSDLDIAGLVASRFGSYVKTVTLSFVRYQDYSRQTFMELMGFHRGYHPTKNDLEKLDGHLEHAFKIYSKAREDYLEIIESGEFLAQLCHVLCKSIGCRKIVLTDRGNCDSNQYRVAHRHDPWRKEDLCPYPTCPLSESDHLSCFSRPSPPFWDGVAREWHLTFLSLSVTKPRITELEVEGEGHDGFLPTSAFTTTPRQSSYVATCFKTLTKLKLSLRRDWDTRCLVAGTLSSAINLETLFIGGYDDMFDYVPNSMSMVLGGCLFTKLRSLSLVNLSSQENDLSELLRNSPLLDHLTIYSFVLNKGTWEMLAASIRAILQLKSVKFNDLYGVVAQYGRDDFRTIIEIQPDLVEDFFLRNGKNPFTDGRRGQ